MTAAMHRLSWVILYLGMVGCVSRGDVEELKRNQEELRKSQGKILAKLDEISKRSLQAPQQRQQAPDPNTVYSFPVKDSPVKGSKDAWVTIVEVSEFQ